MAEGIIKRLIDAKVITQEDIDEYNKQRATGLIRQQVEEASNRVKQTTREYVSSYPIKGNLVGGKYFLPKHVTYISEETFKDCKDLKEIDLSHVEVIGANAFAYCTNLRRVKFGKNLKVIDKYAFWMCTNLQAINLNIQATKIHWTAFMHCPNWLNVSKVLIEKKKAGEEIEWYR